MHPLSRPHSTRNNGIDRKGNDERVCMSPVRGGRVWEGWGYEGCVAWKHKGRAQHSGTRTPGADGNKPSAHCGQGSVHKQLAVVNGASSGGASELQLQCVPRPHSGGVRPCSGYTPGHSANQNSEAEDDRGIGGVSGSMVTQRSEPQHKQTPSTAPVTAQ